MSASDDIDDADSDVYFSASEDGQAHTEDIPLRQFDQAQPNAPASEPPLSKEGRWSAYCTTTIAIVALLAMLVLGIGAWLGMDYANSYAKKSYEVGEQSYKLDLLQACMDHEALRNSSSCTQLQEFNAGALARRYSNKAFSGNASSLGQYQLLKWSIGSDMSPPLLWCVLSFFLGAQFQRYILWRLKWVKRLAIMVSVLLLTGLTLQAVDIITLIETITWFLMEGTLGITFVFLAWFPSLSYKAWAKATYRQGGPIKSAAVKESMTSQGPKGRIYSPATSTSSSKSLYTAMLNILTMSGAGKIIDVLALRTEFRSPKRGIANKGSPMSQGARYIIPRPYHRRSRVSPGKMC